MTSAKEIWLGPVLGNNRASLLARCAEYVARGHADRLLYIAASHPLLDLATERILDGKDCRGVWGEFPFYLFRGFVRRILSGAVLDDGSPIAGPDGRTSDTRTIAPRVPIDGEELPLQRSLISQLIKQLADAGKLPAIRRLANRDGCVNTITSLIGELQRAGKTAEEFAAIVQVRTEESQVSGLKSHHEPSKSQFDFDRDVALIYSLYSNALKQIGLSEDDADQLRALQILQGEVDGQSVSVPALEKVELLVLDGFFDFTPVQGEMLRQLIPAIPNVIVNLNYDERNEPIFQPFQSTIEQLKSIADFDKRIVRETAHSDLRARLFNVGADEPESPTNVSSSLLECADREVEIRTIAKEIKRLIVQDGYQLKDIALVVRERAAYAETILRVCAAESIPCNLERRLIASDIPCVRAALKLFQILRDPEREHVTNPKASDLAHLIKTDYFRISPDDLSGLAEVFERQYGKLLAPDESRLRSALGIGDWSPDKIENVIAYVGAELRVRGWIERAQRLIRVLPSAEAAASFIGASEADDAATPESETPAEENLPNQKPKRPSPVHPAAIAWTTLVMEHVRETIAKVPELAAPDVLRSSLTILIEAFQFSTRVKYPLEHPAVFQDAPQAALDVRGLESLRRAMAATVRSFVYASQVISGGRAKPKPTALGAFIDELERCLKSQVLSVSAGDRDGLRVLEATDVRGLRFRAIFIAGLIEGSFPLRMSRDWLYPHEERERLKKHGVILEDISTVTLLKEEHYFYQCASRATERLYLTRPLAADDGIETVPSYYIEELRRAIAPRTLEAKQIRGDINTRELCATSSAEELTVAIVAQQSRLPRLESVLPRAITAELDTKAKSDGYISDSLLRRVTVEAQRAGDFFGAHDGQITQRDLQALLNNHFGHEYVYSASGLSAYGNCPYKFFAARVLRLEPRNEAALDLPAIDAGKLLHDVLRRFFSRHRKEYLPSLDRGELRKEIAKVADEVFSEHERLVPAINERIWKIDCEIRKLILDQVLLYELRLQERTCDRSMKPTYLELAFGRSSDGSDPDSKAEYLVFARPGNQSETAMIQGQIDRVDVSEDGNFAVAYDYKLSQGARIRDMEAGRQIQIPIYLAALEQLFLPSAELAGGGYYRLRGRGARLNQGLYRKMFENCTDVTTHHAKVDDEDWKRIRATVASRVWQFIDAMRRGDFRVKPSLGRHTCKFCDYAAVCRYDTYRIGRKK